MFRCSTLLILFTSLIPIVNSVDETRQLRALPPNLFRQGTPYMQVLQSSRALRSPLASVGDPVSSAALACMSAIINLSSVVRLVGCALPGDPKMKCRLWQVAICCISNLASLAMVYVVDR
ncbi:hypothetical protein B0O99DRAFT_340371 [Bisporella sp. PMI_857]|nr:hypothetical protein B0O99DRAFT_340371 [Bisporella sp. PMI_857]